MFLPWLGVCNNISLPSFLCSFVMVLWEACVKASAVSFVLQSNHFVWCHQNLQELDTVHICIILSVKINNKCVYEAASTINCFCDKDLWQRYYSQYRITVLLKQIRYWNLKLLYKNVKHLEKITSHIELELNLQISQYLVISVLEICLPQKCCR